MLTNPLLPLFWSSETGLQSFVRIYVRPVYLFENNNNNNVTFSHLGAEDEDFLVFKTSSAGVDNKLMIAFLFARKKKKNK